MIPFQRRFHGFIDSLSRTLTLPDVALPEFFSRKIHLFASDFLILGLALFLFMRFRVSLREYFWEGPSKYLTLLFVTLLISTATSMTNTYSLQYLRLLQFSLVFAFFHSLRCISKIINFSTVVHRLAWMLVIIACFECTAALFQYFTQDAVGLGFLGEKNPQHFLFQHGNSQLWRWGSSLSSTLNTDHICRVAGTFLHPNILGGFLFCSLMASFYLCIKVLSAGQRALLIAVILLQFFTLYLTFSRSAFLALLLSSCVWCALQLKQAINNQELRKPNMRRLALLGSAVFFSLVVGGILFYPQLKSRGGIVNYNAISQNADSERVVYMKAAVEMIKEKPLLGVGYNNFQIYAHQLQPRFPNNYLHAKVHNIYLLIASEAGLIGCGFFLLFLWTILRTAWPPSVGDFQSQAFLLSTFLGLLIIGCCDFYFLENPQGSLLFFGIAGLLYGLRDCSRTRLFRDSRSFLMRFFLA